MPRIRLTFLAEEEVQAVHDASLAILRDTGVMVHHEEVLGLLAEAGAQVDEANDVVRFPEQLVLDCVQRAAKQYVLHGRKPASGRERPTARFGYGDRVLMSSPGQYGWVDMETGERRAPTTDDLHNAVRLGDALPNVSIVGAMAILKDLPISYRDVALTAELVKGTTKPTRCWVSNGQTARYVLEIYRTVAGGAEALRERPMIETFLEPISPLQLPKDGLDILIEFVRAGQPASFGPMAMASGTAPATLVGTLAQENAEILSGIVVTELLAPGTPVTYGGIPHIMDQRTSICSFGSPEQAIMAVAMVQIAHLYGFPVYINVGLTDAKVLDVQAGIEKAASLTLGVLAGADTFGHAGICGTDHGASLPWLFMDNELMDYVARIDRGFEIDEERLATDVVDAVGPGGNFLAEEHTVRHFRRELWFPGSAWTRDMWEDWEGDGRRTMGERAVAEVKEILRTHQPEPMDEALAREIDRIVEAARRELA